MMYSMMNVYFCGVTMYCIVCILLFIYAQYEEEEGEEEDEDGGDPVVEKQDEVWQ